MSAMNESGFEIVSRTTFIAIGRGVREDLAAVVAGTTLYGIYTVLLFVSLYSITRQAKWWTSGPAHFLLSTIIAMFALSTLLCALNLFALWKRIRVVFLQFESGTINTRLRLANSKMIKHKYAAHIAFVAEYLIGDVLLAWRVFALYHWSKIVVCGLSLIWMGTAVSGLGLLACYIENDFASLLPERCHLFEFSGWAITVGFNLTATILLSIVAWNHRKTANVAQIVHKTKVGRVLYILVASGGIYFILACLRLVFYTRLAVGDIHSPWVESTSLTNNILDNMFNQLVGIYPTLVTALVLNERTLFQSSQSPTYIPSKGAMPSLSIQFRRRHETELSSVQLGAIPSRRLDTEDEVSSLPRRPFSIVKAPGAI